MKILVTGSRYLEDERHGGRIRRLLSATATRAILVHGAAPGADTLAAEGAARMGWSVRAYPAEWERWKKAAGPIRNQAMLDHEHTEAPEHDPGFACPYEHHAFDGPIELVLAFPTPDSRGTWDMIERAVAARIPVRTYPMERV